MGTLAIGMMVKNESSIIERALASIINIADFVIITDTGSTDATILKAALFLQNNKIRFKIFFEPFINFAHNRSRVLQLSKEQSGCDYTLMIDADEILVDTPAPHFQHTLDKDYYNINIINDNCSFFLPRLTSNKFDWEYEGVTHEYLKTTNRSEGFTGVSFEAHSDSHRRLSGQKFIDDERLLTAALHEKNLSEGLRARYTFYLAQTYWCMNKWYEAKKYYEERIKLGGWKEEIFYSYYCLGQIHETLDKNNIKDVSENYLAAWNCLDTRIESLSKLQKFYKYHKMFNNEDTIIRIMKSIKHPGVGLFLEDYLYYVWN